VAQALASALSVRHVDTGAMYRALALKALLQEMNLDDPDGVSSVLPDTTIELATDKVFLDGRDVSDGIRDQAVTVASSKVAQHPEVRRWMVARQREIVQEGPSGAVVEGRDIGTVVLPDADLKLFLTASETERARRRSKQAGIPVDEALQDLATRDRRDSERQASPLRAADDAIVIDTTGMALDEVVETILGIIRESDLQASRGQGV
jgi:cytidylate kinase